MRNVIIAACLFGVLCVRPAMGAGVFHASDTTFDSRVDFSEMLRGIQFYNFGEYHCAEVGATEDGYDVGTGVRDCPLHDLDFLIGDWSISLSELLRLIQLYNSNGFVLERPGDEGLTFLSSRARGLWDLLGSFREVDANGDFRLDLSEAQAFLPELTEGQFAEIDASADELLTRFEIYAATQASDDVTPPTIQLLGESLITINCGEEYVDPGVIATDDRDGDITYKIRPFENQVNLYLSGIQTVHYVVWDAAWNVAEATRQVQVLDNEAPFGTLLGAEVLNVECHGTFKDPGVLVTDNCDRERVIYADPSQIDSHTVDSYSLTYAVMDSAGNVGVSINRTLQVVDTNSPSIKLIGPSILRWPSGMEYVEPGVIVTDECDSGLTASVDTSELDVNTPGNYRVRYRAVDSSGNVRNTSRDVRVYDVDTTSFLVIDVGEYCYYENLTPAPLWGSAYAGAAYTSGTTVTVTLIDGIAYNYILLDGEDVSGQVVNNKISFAVSGNTVLAFDSDDCEFITEGVEEGAVEEEGEIASEGEQESEGDMEGEIETEGEIDVEGEGESPALFENPFIRVSSKPLSTFSVDVDTGSYSLARRYLRERGQLPPADKIRIEELLNYFDYDYPLPRGRQPFSVTTEVADCPWAPGHQLMQIGLRAFDLPVGERRPANLVFLLDVSGSMSGADRLPLVKEAMSQLVEEVLGPDDYVSIVTYASTAKKLLLPTPCQPSNKQLILDKIAGLSASGTTNGGQGLEFAYELGAQFFRERGANRIILCSDGDFNVGNTDLDGLVDYVSEQSQNGMALTTLGFGFGNLRDDLMEALADNGNGHYAYIDKLNEAYRVLVLESQALFQIVAKDVKLQVEFNPDSVEKYRLIGYENRRLRDDDFDNDDVDAGDIGAGHSVTAIYELIPVADKLLSYLDVPAMVDLRFKRPNEESSRLIFYPAVDLGLGYEVASPDFTWGSSVASFGMLLRGSAYSGDADWHSVYLNAERAVGPDPYFYRREFLELVDAAAALENP